MNTWVEGIEEVHPVQTRSSSIPRGLHLCEGHFTGQSRAGKSQSVSGGEEFPEGEKHKTSSPLHLQEYFIESVFPEKNGFSGKRFCAAQEVSEVWSGGKAFGHGHVHQPGAKWKI